jgi:DNA-binding NarL/FixJ family response regulator
MIRVAIADDHQIVLDGLVHLLLGEAHIEVVGQALDGGELIALMQQASVDVALVDIDMPRMNGIQACKKIKREFPNTAVVALTMIAVSSIIRRMLEAGASGYLMKNTGKQELLHCLKVVAAGGSYYSEEVADIILADISGKSKESHRTYPRLSKREKEILLLIADEMTTGEIAERLKISFGTVETHRRNIMQKLGARNVVGMVRVAIENGLLD